MPGQVASGTSCESTCRLPPLCCCRVRGAFWNNRERLQPTKVPCIRALDTNVGRPDSKPQLGCRPCLRQRSLPQHHSTWPHSASQECAAAMAVAKLQMWPRSPEAKLEPCHRRVPNLPTAVKLCHHCRGTCAGAGSSSILQVARVVFSRCSEKCNENLENFFCVKQR